MPFISCLPLKFCALIFLRLDCVLVGEFTGRHVLITTLYSLPCWFLIRRLLPAPGPLFVIHEIIRQKHNRKLQLFQQYFYAIFIVFDSVFGKRVDLPPPNATKSLPPLVIVLFYPIRLFLLKLYLCTVAITFTAETNEQWMNAFFYPLFLFFARMATYWLYYFYTCLRRSLFLHIIEDQPRSFVSKDSDNELQWIHIFL